MKRFQFDDKVEEFRSVDKVSLGSIEKFSSESKDSGIWSIGVPAHKLDEDLLKCLDLVHGIGQAEKAGFGSANIFALLVDYPPGSCKMKIRSDMRILLFFALMPIQMFVPLQHKTHLSQ